MKLKKVITLGAVLLLTGGLAQAAHMWEDTGGWWDSHFTAGGTAPKYTDNELSMDFFGSYWTFERKFTTLFQQDIRHGLWGGGVGVNYFFLKYAGIGGDFNVSAHGGGIFDYGIGHGILRLPLGNTGLAPYIYGGAGRAVSPEWEWLYDGGVGLEYRFNPTTGLFADGRYMWAQKLEDRLVLRVGVRVVF